jgi:hypothetical protein
VDHAGRVRRSQRLGDVDGNRQGLIHGKRAA